MSTTENALAIVPESIRALVANQIKGSRDLQRAVAFVPPQLLEGCETVEDALEILKTTAEAMLCDEQANYIPAVYTIHHRNQRFLDDAGDAIKGPFRAVVIYFQPTRGFFLEGVKLPLCSAIGTHDKGKARVGAQEDWSKHNLYQPQNPITWEGKERDCATCPFNEFGSDPKTGAGKACKEKYRLFLALVDAQGNLTGEGVMMNVPTTSMKNWDGYISRLKRYKDPLTSKLQLLTSLSVVTAMELEKAQGQGQDYAKINPKVERLLTADEFKLVSALRNQIKGVADTIGVEVGESYDQAETENNSSGQQNAEPAFAGGDVPF